MANIHVELRGLDDLKRKLRAAPEQLQRYLSAAGNEAGHEVIASEGLQKYPPATAANAPPTPYYIRGRGTQLKSRNLGESQRYGTQFFVNAAGLKTTIGNRASYAQWLTDENKQSHVMARIGWRKLIDVAREKQAQVIRIFEAWVAKGIRDSGL